VNTGRPYITACDIHPVNLTDTSVDGDFPEAYLGAKCRLRIVLVGATYRLNALVDVWAGGVSEIDRIVQALELEMKSYIVEG
jgi:hypothetical protein